MADEAGGDDQVLPLAQAVLRPGQEIARNLLDDELVIRLVVVQRGDDPVAPSPLLTWQVFLVAIAVGIARGIEPMATPLLAVVGRGQEAVDHSLHGRICRQGMGGRKGIELRQRRGQSG